MRQCITYTLRVLMHGVVFGYAPTYLLNATVSVCRQNAKKTRFSQKLSNLELWSLLTTYRRSAIFDLDAKMQKCDFIEN